jgi:hypothetical protein
VIYVGLSALASAATGKAFNVRYTLPALVGFVTLAATATDRLPALLRALAVAALCALFGASDLHWFSSPTYGKDDSRGAVRWFAQRLAPGATVAVAPSYASRALEYYALRETVPLRFVPSVGAADRELPVGFALTRRHHVPDQADLVARLRAAYGARLVQGAVVGYEMWAVRPGP